MLSKYEQTLLEGWEEVHKRGQLTLWILLALKDGPKHMNNIKQFISEATDNAVSADDKSMYRALRRYSDAEMIDFTAQPSKNGGPDLKIYKLTEIGRNVLEQFIQRNVVSLFINQSKKELFL
jgi:PadR family transcriptional regulator PadR